MPELPEVEVTKLGISPHIENQIVSKVVVRQTQLRWLVPDSVQNLLGLPIIKVERIAKYLLLHNELGCAVLHLGMSGKLRVVDKTTELIKHDHVDIEFSNKKVLRFNDPRRFGAFLWQDKDDILTQLSHLGPEPLTDEFDANTLYALAKGRKTAIKSFIMDNNTVVGVGNIYANESLFLAKIRPTRAAGNISLKRYIELVKYIKLVLKKAIEQGGTTLKDFTQADGKPGYFAQELLVYGRAGLKCKTCDEVLKEVRLGQRSTVYCAKCQT